MLVADPVANRILRISLAGGVLDKHPGDGYGLKEPNDLAVGDLLWVADNASGSIAALHLPSDDRATHVTGSVKNAEEELLAEMPLATSVFAEGQGLWVTDAASDRVYRFQLSNP